MFRSSYSTARKFRGFETRLVAGDDGYSIEVEVEKGQALNDVFIALGEQGIQVQSMRNKANRLEEMFVSMTNGDQNSTDQAEQVCAVSPAEKWIAFRTIVTKEIRRFTRIWLQTLLPPAITISLYFIIFGTLIGPRIGEMAGFQLYGVCSAGFDYDVGYYQLLFQCGVIVF